MCIHIYRYIYIYTYIEQQYDQWMRLKMGYINPPIWLIPKFCTSDSIPFPYPPKPTQGRSTTGVGKCPNETSPN